MAEVESKRTSSHEEDVDVEKPRVVEEVGEQQRIELDRLGEEEGYILDVDTFREGHRAEDLKLARDGKTVLIPQPSDDPHDPLNWSQLRKNAVLIIVSCCAFLPDYGSATGAVTLLAQAQIWNMTEDHVNHSQAGNVFMLGACGLFVTVFSAYFGRLPVLFWFLVMAVWTAAWCAGATTFNQFMAARILNGFFSSVAQAVGTDILNRVCTLD
jgi:hypothetical protein